MDNRKLKILICKSVLTVIVIFSLYLFANDCIFNHRLYCFYQEFSQIAINTVSFYPKSDDDTAEMTSYLDSVNDISYGIYPFDYGILYGQLFVSGNGELPTVKAEKNSDGYFFRYDTGKTSVFCSNVYFIDEVFGEFPVRFTDFSRLYEEDPNGNIPIIVGGKNYSKLKIGDLIKIGFSLNKNGEKNYALYDCVVCGKADLPFPPVNVYNPDFYSAAGVASEGIIYMPKYALPGFDNTNVSRCITFFDTDINEIIPHIQEYGYIERASYIEDIAEYTNITFKYRIQNAVSLVVLAICFVGMSVLLCQKTKLKDKRDIFGTAAINICTDVICGVIIGAGIKKFCEDMSLPYGYISAVECAVTVAVADVLMLTIYCIAKRRSKAYDKNQECI